MQRFFLFTALLLTPQMLAGNARAAQPTAATPRASTAPADLAMAPGIQAESPAEGRVLATAINLAAQQKMPESFGAPHQWVVGGSSSFNLHGLHLRLQDKTANQLSVAIDPWVGMFVARHLLIGALLPISYARGGGVWFANVGVGPLLGWHIPLGTHLALLPRVSAAYQFGRVSRASASIAEARSDAHMVFVNARIDAVIHLSHHFSVVMGPYASQSVLNRSGGRKNPYETYYGAQAGLLGWF